LPEWLVEEGIGEHRALCFAGEDVIAAMIDWPGQLAPGQVENAVLVSKVRNATRGRARFASGEEALVDRLPRDASEGAEMRFEVLRTRFDERGRIKLAQARPTDKPERPAPTLFETLQQRGNNVRIVRNFPGDDWEEIWSEAWCGFYDPPCCSLHFTTAPAMTVIDVDGRSVPRELALAAAEGLGRALPRFDLHGSVGIDFPTLTEKADRRAVDEALEKALADWPHERTAMNGFGFVQIVSRLERPSIIHRVQQGRVGAAARLLMRRICEDPGMPGDLLVTCHPAVRARLKPEWIEEAKRRTGRDIRIETDPGLALDGGFAQAVPR
jgi:hypothetical protein